MKLGNIIKDKDIVSLDDETGIVELLEKRVIGLDQIFLNLLAAARMQNGIKDDHGCNSILNLILSNIVKGKLY